MKLYYLPKPGIRERFTIHTKLIIATVSLLVLFTDLYSQDFLVKFYKNTGSTFTLNEVQHSIKDVKECLNIKNEMLFSPRALRVAKNCKLTLYTEKAFSGAETVYYGGDYNRIPFGEVSKGMVKLPDIQSFKVEKLSQPIPLVDIYFSLTRKIGDLISPPILTYHQKLGINETFDKELIFSNVKMLSLREIIEEGVVSYELKFDSIVIPLDVKVIIAEYEPDEISNTITKTLALPLAGDIEPRLHREVHRRFVDPKAKEKVYKNDTITIIKEFQKHISYDNENLGFSSDISITTVSSYKQ